MRTEQWFFNHEIILFAGMAYFLAANPSVPTEIKIDRDARKMELAPASLGVRLKWNRRRLIMKDLPFCFISPSLITIQMAALYQVVGFDVH